MTVLNLLPPLSLLRLTQALVALITLSVLAHLASLLNNSASRIATPPQLNFTLFTAIYTLLVILPYTALAPRWFPRLAQRYVMVGAEVSAGLFWFAGMAALADWVRKGGRMEEGKVREGSSDIAGKNWEREKATAVAGTCFAAFEFIFFAISASFAVSHLLSKPSLKETSWASSHHRRNHHGQVQTRKMSVGSSITSFFPNHATHQPTTPVTTTTTTNTIHIHDHPSSKDPPYKRTQYRFFDSSAPTTTIRRSWPRMWSGVKGGGDLMCGLGLSGKGPSLGKGSLGDRGHGRWEKMDGDVRPNLVVVVPPSPPPPVPMKEGSASMRPYSTKVMDVVGKVWGGVSGVVGDVSARVRGGGAGAGAGAGGIRMQGRDHSGWFGNGAAARTTTRGAENRWMRIGIGNPDGARRQWDGADVV